MLAQEFCRSRRAPGREPGANENAALFSIQWPMRYQGFLAIPARLPSMRSATRRCRSLGQDLPLFRRSWSLQRCLSAVRTGREASNRTGWSTRTGGLAPFRPHSLSQAVSCGTGTTAGGLVGGRVYVSKLTSYQSLVSQSQPAAKSLAPRSPSNIDDEAVSARPVP